MGSRARLLLLFLLALAATLLAWNSGRWALRQLRIDACLDAGGCWDGVRDRCADVPAECRPTP